MIVGGVLLLDHVANFHLHTSALAFEKIHNLYLVVIGQMVFADGAEVGDGSR
jgi:uncharacterized membrane protein YdcZ (DUF606 family)